MEDSNPELESFRRQWREEVSAKAQAERRKTPASKNIPSSSRHPVALSSGGDRADESDRPAAASNHTSTNNGQDPEECDKSGSREPRSALEYYERAVESENRGNLTDSLNLYRKAFRMDDRVTELYKNKHFPPSFFAKKPPVAASPSVKANPSTANSSAFILATTDLILSFSELSIPPAPAEVEGTPPPPCPLARLPAEILTSILLQTAFVDLSSFVRLSLVCKRFAYLVATEETIWKRICLGTEVGFGGMFYDWQCEITWEKIYSDTLNFESLQIEDEENLPVADDHDGSDAASKVAEATAQDTQPLITQPMVTEMLLTHVYKKYHNMLRLRPRIRFNGVYISTITYHRPGQASVTQVTWNSPVHTVTYYRYLRFFRDGSCISLLTSVEPAEVVGMITPENLEKHAGGKVEGGRRDRRILVGGDGDVSAVKNVMKNALKGRWHLSSITSPESGIPSTEAGVVSKELPSVAEIESAEGDCYIETEGVDPKYIYRMELSLKDGKMKERGRRNNRLSWKGYWLYNKITDDWGEFGLRNDKSFVFSRVRSYEDS